MKSEQILYKPILYVINGKIQSIPCKMTYMFNNAYKTELQTTETFPDYRTCQQYCIEKDKI